MSALLALVTGNEQIFTVTFLAALFAGLRLFFVGIYRAGHGPALAPLPDEKPARVLAQDTQSRLREYAERFPERATPAFGEDGFRQVNPVTSTEARGAEGADSE